MQALEVDWTWGDIGRWHNLFVPPTAVHQGPHALWKTTLSNPT